MVIQFHVAPESPSTIGKFTENVRWDQLYGNVVVEFWYNLTTKAYRAVRLK